MREKITKMRGDKDWDANNLISSWNDYWEWLVFNLINSKVQLMIYDIWN
jgi:hypothetical protein